MQSSKNTPRSTEEQHKAFEEFLAAQEAEGKPTSPKKDKRISKKLSGMPFTRFRSKKTLSHSSLSEYSEEISTELAKKPDTDSSDNTSEEITKPKVPESARPFTYVHEDKIEKPEPQDNEIVISKTSKNKPLTPEEQEKAFQEYLARMEKEKQPKEPEKLVPAPVKEVVIAKTSKNKPLSPAEQEKAFQEYLTSMEKEKQPATNELEKPTEKIAPVIAKTSKNKPLTPEEQEKAFQAYLASMEKEKEKEPEKAEEKAAPVIAKTSKNKPLSPEEQEKAFQEYLASMEKEKGEKPVFAKASKNKPLSPEEQQKAMEEFLRQQELKQNTAGPRMKSSSKNRPLTPEEQKIAFKEFRARQLQTETGQPTSPSAVRKTHNKILSRATSNILKRVQSEQIPRPVVKEEPQFPPLPKGQELTQFLLYNHDVVCAALEAAKFSNQSEVVDSILNIFMSNRIEHNLISGALQVDIDTNDSEGTLFRDNTPGTQLFSAYAKRVGRFYLENVLAIFYEKVMYRKEAVEVDPARTSEEAAEKNTEKLFEIINNLLDRIFRSQAELPQCLGRLIHRLQNMVVAKYPNVRAKITGGFYFLRFFSPMTLSPKTYGLLDHDITASCRRSLILSTKVIQSLSNNVPFTTEQYMVPFNGIVEGRQEECQKFLSSLGEFENMKDDPSLFAEYKTPSCLNNSLRILAKSMAVNFKEIEESVTDGQEKIKKLRNILESIHNIEPIDWVDPEERVAKPVVVEKGEPEFEVSREAFALLREAFQQCEAELKETKIRLEEEVTLRKSLQTVIVSLADSIHSQIDDRVSFKLQQIHEKAKSMGVDDKFCEKIGQLCIPEEEEDEEPQAEAPSKSKPAEGPRPSARSGGDIMRPTEIKRAGLPNLNEWKGRQLRANCETEKIPSSEKPSPSVALVPNTVADELDGPKSTVKGERAKQPRKRAPTYYEEENLEQETYSGVAVNKGDAIARRSSDSAKEALITQEKVPVEIVSPKVNNQALGKPAEAPEKCQSEESLSHKEDDGSNSAENAPVEAAVSSDSTTTNELPKDQPENFTEELAEVLNEPEETPDKAKETEERPSKKNPTRSTTTQQETTGNVRRCSPNHSPTQTPIRGGGRGRGWPANQNTKRGASQNAGRPLPAPPKKG